jgi:hypothetical protein
MNVDELRRFRRDLTKRLEKNETVFTTAVNKSDSIKEKLSAYYDILKELTDLIINTKEKILEIAVNMKPEKVEGFRGALLKDVLDRQAKVYKDFMSMLASNKISLPSLYDICEKFNIDFETCVEIDKKYGTSEISNRIQEIISTTADIYSYTLLFPNTYLYLDPKNRDKVIERLKTFDNEIIEILMKRPNSVENMLSDHMDFLSVLKEDLSRLIYVTEMKLLPYLYKMDKDLHSKLAEILLDLKIIERQLGIVIRYYRKSTLDVPEEIYDLYRGEIFTTLSLTSRLLEKIRDYTKIYFDSLKRVTEHFAKNELKNVL